MRSGDTHGIPFLFGFLLCLTHRKLSVLQEFRLFRFFFFRGKGSIAALPIIFVFNLVHLAI